MPDTGAPWNIPYVASSDLVKDWPTDSQTLAEAIADGLDAAGFVQQIQSTARTDTFSASVAQGAVSAAAISVTITPASATNRILVLAQLNIAAQSQDEPWSATLYRAGSAIYIGNASSNRRRATTLGWGMDNTAASVSIVYLDSPATTSSTTYDVRLSHGYAGTRNVYLNRTHTNSDSSAFPLGASSITVVEVPA